MLEAVFNNLDFCTSIANDFTIWGEQPYGSDHEKHHTDFFQFTRKHNLKLNMEKLQYKTKHTNFFGTTLASHSHKPEMKGLSN